MTTSQYEKIKEALGDKGIEALDKVVDEICKVFYENPTVSKLRLVVEDHRSEGNDKTKEIVINNPWYTSEVME